MKIGVVDKNSINGLTYWRSFNAWNHLKKIFPEVEIVCIYEQTTFWEIGGLDILVVNRPANTTHLHLIQIAKRQNIPVIVDYDDDLFNVHPSNPAWVHFQGEVKNIIKQALEMADVVTVSTQYLGEELRKHAVIKNILVLPNSSLPTFAQAGPVDTSNIKIVWRGSASHVRDLNTSKTIIKKLSEKENVTLSFYGYYPNELGLEEGSFEYYNWNDTYSYFENLHKNRPDFIICPLEDIGFNHCKSNIAWQEATIAGAALVTNFAGNEWQYDGIINGMQKLLHTPKDKLTDLKKEAVLKSRGSIEEHFNLFKISFVRLELCKQLFNGSKIFFEKLYTKYYGEENQNKNLEAVHG